MLTVHMHGSPLPGLIRHGGTITGHHTATTAGIGEAVCIHPGVITTTGTEDIRVMEWVMAGIVSTEDIIHITEDTGVVECMVTDTLIIIIHGIIRGIIPTVEAILGIRTENRITARM